MSRIQNGYLYEASGAFFSPAFSAYDRERRQPSAGKISILRVFTSSRSVVRGIVGTPKMLESVASLPLIDQVRGPLELWRLKSGNPTSGWVFPSRNDTPIDLHNLINRVISPVLKEAGINYFSGLYAGRRGACTAVVEATGGNYAVAQALLRHKSMVVTLNTYKKQITPAAFKAGMKLFQNTITPS